MSQKVINQGYHYFDVLMVTHITLLLSFGIVTHREVIIYHSIVPGGMLVIPFCFGVSCLFCRLYGMKEYYKFLFNSLLSLFIFSLITYILIELPSSTLGNNSTAYLKIFGNIIVLYMLFGSIYSLLSIAANQVLKLTHNFLFSLLAHVIALFIFGVILDLFLSTFHQVYPPYSQTVFLSLTCPIFIGIVIFSLMSLLVKCFKRLEGLTSNKMQT